MNFSTSYCVLLAFVVLNLVNLGSAADVMCSWSFHSTAKSVCSDGNFKYTFPNSACHRTKPNELSPGVDCVRGRDNKDPPEGLTCEFYDLIYHKNWQLNYYDCGNVPTDPAQRTAEYKCKGVNNIQECHGDYLAREQLPPIITK
ncbi:uncharacterized protein MELLADRAFT_123744 [Melampsora larici-populina 98AG31]|uniref:Secreted protein n=1 Tax=Melampsora larici-populina (strain 98AG31 / pathotype 3-4-7) TaxID=747676 RepID=F4RYR9_MELLP|nr:uncharacterized protein MELLADRAFT_123744 [Melampsora larici-populina 98AG31]EGG02519.1 secreted protein [Melampsora larici-populina 98AG31]